MNQKNKKLSSRKNRVIHTVSLFAGCGGSDLGLLGDFEFVGTKFPKLNYSIVYANDIDEHAAKTYKQNIGDHITVEDINNINAADIPNHDLLIGGFPCQSFSIAGQRKGFDDARGELYLHMVDFLKEKQPKVFIAENVKGILSVDGGRAFGKIISDFESSGYKVKHKLVNATDFGVPQKRQRVFIIGVRNDIKKDFNFEEPSAKRVILKDVLENRKDIDKKYFFSERAHQGLRNANKAFNKGRSQDINSQCNTISTHLAKSSLNGTDPVITVGKEKYRRLTPLEAARIQSFPDNFEFVGSDSKKYIQIGNAIAPVVMWHIAKSVQNQIFS
ncbi:MAG: DNA (cytosine-5-)-methyltransferase [Candidatus Pacebacteria bacterium]|nr:DNA (cytosine-5-)-methyltransferase [Candidatus Paceibacterota bacterium]